MCIIQTKYCDSCEALVKLTEDGHCTGCGKHADNMPKTEEEDDFIKSIPEDWYDDNELGGEG